MAWFPQLVHAFNQGEIPLALQITDSCLYTRDTNVDTQCYVVHTLTHQS